ncbi:hypothetical protein KCMC57_up14260 [Kitasatospora sp. CMC57]|uniref:Transposase n=1 Tax=Kitasatospora sp. CMC57 TaxID=3231513 RepID=A0AB33JP71_9ACTN
MHSDILTAWCGFTPSLPTLNQVTFVGIDLTHGHVYVRGAGPFTQRRRVPPRKPVLLNVIVRVVSRFYNAAVVAACRRAHGRLSLTAWMNPDIAAVIPAIR